MTALSTEHGAPVPSACTGLFESHVTVRCGEEDLSKLEQWSLAKGVKLTHIVLARGRQQSQPMLTRSRAGSLAAQHADAYRLVGELRGAGFAPVRVKIEAACWADWIPQTAAEAQQQHPARYFEHHVKLLLSPDACLARLAERVSPHGAHVSWNARRTLGHGRQERFVTQRCHRLGLPQAADRLASLLAVLRGGRHEVLAVEQEYVVHDSNTTLDDGWITGEAAA